MSNQHISQQKKYNNTLIVPTISFDDAPPKKKPKLLSTEHECNLKEAISTNSSHKTTKTEDHHQIFISSRFQIEDKSPKRSPNHKHSSGTSNYRQRIAFRRSPSSLHKDDTYKHNMIKDVEPKKFGDMPHAVSTSLSKKKSMVINRKPTDRNNRNTKREALNYQVTKTHKGRLVEKSSENFKRSLKQLEEVTVQKINHDMSSDIKNKQNTTVSRTTSPKILKDYDITEHNKNRQKISSNRKKSLFDKIKTSNVESTLITSLKSSSSNSNDGHRIINKQKCETEHELTSLNLKNCSKVQKYKEKSSITSKKKIIHTEKEALQTNGERNINTNHSIKNAKYMESQKSVVHKTDQYNFSPSSPKHKTSKKKYDLRNKLKKRSKKHGHKKSKDLNKETPNTSQENKKTLNNVKQTNIKTIKLIINIVYDQPNHQNDRNKNEKNVDNQFSSADLSFLDNFDVDEIIECLNQDEKKSTHEKQVIISDTNKTCSSSQEIGILLDTQAKKTCVLPREHYSVTNDTVNNAGNDHYNTIKILREQQYDMTCLDIEQQKDQAEKTCVLPREHYSVTDDAVKNARNEHYNTIKILSEQQHDITCLDTEQEKDNTDTGENKIVDNNPVNNNADENSSSSENNSSLKRKTENKDFVVLHRSTTNNIEWFNKEKHTPMLQTEFSKKDYDVTKPVHNTSFRAKERANKDIIAKSLKSVKLNSCAKSCDGNEKYVECSNNEKFKVKLSNISDLIKPSSYKIKPCLQNNLKSITADNLHKNSQTNNICSTSSKIDVLQTNNAKKVDHSLLQEIYKSAKDSIKVNQNAEDLSSIEMLRKQHKENNYISLGTKKDVSNEGSDNKCKNKNILSAGSCASAKMVQKSSETKGAVVVDNHTVSNDSEKHNKKQHQKTPLINEIKTSNIITKNVSKPNIQKSVTSNIKNISSKNTQQKQVKNINRDKNNEAKTHNIVETINKMIVTKEKDTSIPGNGDNTNANMMCSSANKINQSKTVNDLFFDKAFKNAVEKRMQSHLNTKFDVDSLLHIGKHSKIYSCKDPHGKRYALKITNFTKDSFLFGTKKEMMLKLMQKDIPKENFNCVYLIKGFAVNQDWGFLLEYYPKNLRNVLTEATKCFHIDHIKILAKQLISAIMLLRNNNIIHKDIKPEHILLNNTLDRLKLCGFDDAQYAGSFPTVPNIGTTAYRAPEVILGHSAGFSIDVWSSALVLYEMATRKKLFSGIFNNDILYQQMCVLGNVTQEMLMESRYMKFHFQGSSFMKRYGYNGKKYVLISNFNKSNKIETSLFEAYYKHWDHSISKEEREEELNKIRLFLELLEQMMILNPSYRLPIEFVYANRFVFD